MKAYKGKTKRALYKDVRQDQWFNQNTCISSKDYITHNEGETL